MKVYIVNGMPGSGKTTFEDCCANHIHPKGCHILSTIDCVKEIAKTCGWDGRKDDKSRKFLSDLKDLLTNYNNLPFKVISKKVGDIARDDPESAVFIDCREPNEIDKLRETFNAKTILIRRESVENEVWSNHADTEVFNYNYDYIIENNGSMLDLIYAVEAFLIEEKW